MDSYTHEIQKGKVRCVLQGPVAPEPNVSEEEPMLQAGTMVGVLQKWNFN